MKSKAPIAMIIFLSASQCVNAMEKSHNIPMRRDQVKEMCASEILHAKHQLVELSHEKQILEKEQEFLKNGGHFIIPVEGIRII